MKTGGFIPQAWTIKNPTRHFVGPVPGFFAALKALHGQGPSLNKGEREGTQPEPPKRV